MSPFVEKKSPGDVVCPSCGRLIEEPSDHAIRGEVSEKEDT